MNVGDRVRLRPRTSCQEALGLHEGQEGIVRDIDATQERTCLLISFDDVDVYTSALEDDDFEILRPAAHHCRDAGRAHR